MVRLHGGYLALCLLLGTSVAYEHDLKTNHEGSSFVLDQGEAADAGNDAKMTDLTDSIQGLFSDPPAAPAGKKASAKLAKTATKAVPQPKAVAPQPKPKVVGKVAKAPLAKVVAAQVAKAPVVPKVVAHKPKSTGALKSAKAATAKPKAEVTVAVAKAPQAKTVAAKVVAKPIKAVKAVAKPVNMNMPMPKPVAKEASVAKKAIAKPSLPKAQKVHATRPAKVAMPKPVAPVAKVAVPKSMPKPIAKVQVAEKASQSSVGVPVTKLQVLKKAKAVPAKAVPAKAVSKAVSKAADHKAKKAIEEAVVSLPMASFALDIPTKPVANKTEHKFPGNATQKKQWMKKESDLEHEIETLKSRLASSSQAHKDVAPQKQQKQKEQKHEKVLQPTAPKNLMSSKKSEPAPVAAPVAPHVVAAPVAHHTVSAAGAPPQTQGKAKAASMGATFTDNLAEEREDFAKQMEESALAVHATVAHSTFVADSSSEDAESSAASPPTLNPQASWWNYFRSFFWHSMPAPAAVAPKPAAAALIDLAHKRGLKQDMLRTEQATKEESEHIIQVNDAWSQMEQDDGVKEEEVRREDMAERERAETPETVKRPSKDQLKGRHGADMSNFWIRLEKEDYGIEHSVDNENLNEYERLIKLQDEQVTTAAQQVQNNKLNTERTELRHNDDKRLAIHEPWQAREERDVLLEKKIHDAPELQMLQLRHHHKRQ